MNYPLLLKEIKDRIRQAQVRAALSANAEMLFMYWDVGRIIAERRSVEGWGTRIIQRLAQDIRNDLPETKGFSERNLKRMLAFHNEYKALVNRRCILTHHVHPKMTHLGGYSARARGGFFKGWVKRGVA
jgi:hypothetical protein